MSGQDGGRRLKVYGVNRSVGRRPQVRCIVAAHNIPQAAALFGVSPSYLRTYGSETGNDEEIAVAKAQPGKVFWQEMNTRGPWTRLGEEAPDGR